MDSSHLPQNMSAMLFCVYLLIKRLTKSEDCLQQFICTLGAVSSTIPELKL